MVRSFIKHGLTRWRQTFPLIDLFPWAVVSTSTLSATSITLGGGFSRGGPGNIENDNRYRVPGLLLCLDRRKTALNPKRDVGL
jgi:hypothetical protein